jgi:hypothetical protein
MALRDWEAFSRPDTPRALRDMGKEKLTYENAFVVKRASNLNCVPRRYSFDETLSSANYMKIRSSSGQDCQPSPCRLLAALSIERFGTRARHRVFFVAEE